MSKTNRDESLFADSTMSFGEHIEELRGALARAILGLTIGIGIAFFFADEAVQWIEKPLKDGLTQFNVSKATLDFEDDLTPEQLDLITDSRMAPTEIMVEAEMLWHQVHRAYPEQIPAASFQTYDFQPADFANISKIAAALTHAPKTGSFHDLVRAQLSETQLKQLNDLATSTAQSSATDGVDTNSATTEGANDAKTAGSTDTSGAILASILNQVLKKSELTAGTTEKMVKSLYASVEQRNALLLLLDQAKSDSELTPRVNRLLLSVAFAPHLPAQKPRFLRLITWKPVEASIQAFRVEESFMVWFKAAFVVGALISAPWVFYQLWNFVAAGLYPHEKNYVHTFLPFSLTLFFAGAALAFFFVFPYVLKFLFSFNQKIGVDINPRLNEWLSFALFMPLGFGISFQLPLVMLLLERIGVVTVELYVSKWRIAVLIISVLSMLLTPADPSSMLLMAIPLVLLYFGGICLCKWMPKRSSPLGAGYDP